MRELVAKSKSRNDTLSASFTMSIPPYWLWLKPILSLVFHLVANLKSLLSTGWAYVTRTGEYPMSESYKLKPINKPVFSNLEQGGTSENEVKKEDECFNSQLEISWQGIGDLDRCVMEMTSGVGHYPDIIHHVFCEIFYLSMLGLAGGPGRHPPARNRFENRFAEPGPVLSRGLGGVRDRKPVRGRFTLLVPVEPARSWPG
ncbi:hypothetical protein H5410_036559 [Solanum commersonii]|uniref:Uncharacterized protein n=1 Tax=Solanum commersonii TaxID=4109 RepID=A0A9J5Y603_SOLCO|nr:hypothetical protein H5410_036559 [Solanum commersonii]